MARSAGLLLGGALLLSPLSNALTMEEMEKRLVTLESEAQAREAKQQAEIDRLRRELRKLQQSTGQSSDGDLQERVIKVEKTLAKEKKRTKKRLKKLKEQVETEKERLSIHGFASAAVGKVEAKNNTPVGYQGYTEQVRWQPESVMGLQLEFKLDDKNRFTTQLAGFGNSSENFDVDVEWAYLTHKFTDSLSLRIGALRLPFFMLSDYVDVGVAYPFARPPAEVYDGTIDSYDGLDLLYNFSIGPTTHTLEAFVGSHRSTEVSAELGSLNVDEIGGLKLDSSWGPFRIVAGYARGKLDANLQGDAGDVNQLFLGVEQSDPLLEALGGGPITIGLGDEKGILPDNATGDFTSFGFVYDDGTWMIMGEHIRQRMEGFFANEEANYLLAGRRFGSVMPYAMYSRLYTVDDDIRHAALDKATNAKDATADENLGAVLDASLGVTDEVFCGSTPVLDDGTTCLQLVQAGLENFTYDQRTYSLGVRYDWSPSIAVKFQWDHVTDLADTSDRGGSGSGGGLDLYVLKIDSSF